MFRCNKCGRKYQDKPNKCQICKGEDFSQTCNLKVKNREEFEICIPKLGV